MSKTPQGPRPVSFQCRCRFDSNAVGIERTDVLGAFKPRMAVWRVLRAFA